MATIRLEHEKLHSEIQGVKSELRSEIQSLAADVKINLARIADLQDAFAIYFTIATLFITFLAIVTGVLIVFAPRIWAFLEKRKHDPAVSQKQLQNIIDKAIARAFSSIQCVSYSIM